MSLPKDPILLFSIVNTALRDFYPSLDAYCDNTGENKDEIISALASAGFVYDSENNKFV